MISKLLLLVLALFSGLAAPVSSQVVPSNNCYTFTVGQGTGCQYMCSLCANQLGTNNYYFTDNVCTYDSVVGYCTGNPQQYKQYTCCAAGEDNNKDEL
jgi:hypothetical protein